MATQAERIAALEAQIVELHAALEAAPRLIEDAVRLALNASLQPLADKVVEAHGRIDHAAVVFKDLRRALTPKREPSTRVPHAEFQAALEDLRADAHEAGSDRRYFPTPDILARAQRLAQMRADTLAAGA